MSLPKSSTEGRKPPLGIKAKKTTTTLVATALILTGGLVWAHSGKLDTESDCDKVTGNYNVTFTGSTSNVPTSGKGHTATLTVGEILPVGAVAVPATQTVIGNTTFSFTMTVPGNTKQVQATAFLTWGDGATSDPQGKITLDGTCKKSDKPNASASLHVTEPTCTEPGILVYDSIENATWSGTPDGTRGPGSFSTTAIANSGSTFPDKSPTQPFSGVLPGPDTSKCIQTQTVVFVQQACVPPKDSSSGDTQPAMLSTEKLGDMSNGVVLASLTIAKLADYTGTFVPGTIEVPDVPGVRYTLTFEDGTVVNLPTGTLYATDDWTASGTPFFGKIVIRAYPANDGDDPLGGTTEFPFNFTDPRPCGDEIITASATATMHQCVVTDGQTTVGVGSVTLVGDGTWTIVSDHDTYAGPAGTVVSGVPSGTYDARLNGEDSSSPPYYGKVTFTFNPPVGTTLDGAQNVFVFNFVKPKLDCGLAVTGASLNPWISVAGGAGILTGLAILVIAIGMKRRNALR